MMNTPNDRPPGAAPNPPPGRPATPPTTPGTNPGETVPHARSPIVPPTPPVPPRPVQISGTVGGDVAAGDLHKEQTAGRDIVGRDVVTNTTTTNVGFSAAIVLRLVIAVGVMVFVTAACFFSGGAVVGVGIIALARPVNSTNPAAADRFEAALDALKALPRGQPFEFTFTEEEISSYFRLRVAPTLPGHITDGKVRLLDNGQVVVGGRAGDLGGLAFAATFNWQNVPGRPLRLAGAALQVLPLGKSVVGWVAVPTVGLRPIENTVNSLFGNVQITGVTSSGSQVWTVTGVAQ